MFIFEDLPYVAVWGHMVFSKFHDIWKAWNTIVQTTSLYCLFGMVWMTGLHCFPLGWVESIYRLIIFLERLYPLCSFSTFRGGWEPTSPKIRYSRIWALAAWAIHCLHSDATMTSCWGRRSVALWFSIRILSRCFSGRDKTKVLDRTYFSLLDSFDGASWRVV